jgi:hypothetical protein
MNGIVFPSSRKISPRQIPMDNLLSADDVSEDAAFVKKGKEIIIKM